MSTWKEVRGGVLALLGFTSTHIKESSSNRMTMIRSLAELLFSITHDIGNEGYSKQFAMQELAFVKGMCTALYFRDARLGDNTVELIYKMASFIDLAIEQDNPGVVPDTIRSPMLNKQLGISETHFSPEFIIELQSEVIFAYKKLNDTEDDGFGCLEGLILGQL